MKRICVFCGSRSGSGEVYASAARELGSEMVRRGLDLVYGGGNVGLMGVLADAVLAAGGHVTGVIPAALAARERSHLAIQDLRTVGSMHKRKALMADLSDGFIAIPGGLGTLEELFEVLTWGQLGFHRKPIALLNVSGYFDSLLSFIDHAVEHRFVRSADAGMVIVEDEVGLLFDRLLDYEAPEVSHGRGRDSR